MIRVSDPAHAKEGARQLIIVGASAGGIEALSTLVSALPVPLIAPLVVAQHLSPDRPSHLRDILAHHTRLPVHSVESQATLEAGVIYVVPPNRDAEVKDGTLCMAAAHGHPGPSIDRLLRSAAASVGEGVIAVVLSGAGSDGSAGAQAVKEAGGTVIIQNPAGARFSGMPGALPLNSVDIVADLSEVGSLLGELLKGWEPDAPALEALLKDVHEHCGIDFSNYKKPTILRRLKRRIIAVHCTDLSSYRFYLLEHPDEYQILCNSLLIKATRFMRDDEVFRHLKDVVFPELIQHAQTHGAELRIWSAGCSTGEEAYSLAILASETLGSNPGKIVVRIFATDIDAGAIAHARRGIYPTAAVEGLAPTLRERYFSEHPDTNSVQLKKALRVLTVFGVHDLALRAPFPRIDLVVCRNVLIYFTPELQRRALSVFAFSMRPGAILVLGLAETPSSTSGLFVPQNPSLKVYTRTAANAPMPHAHPLPVLGQNGLTRVAPNRSVVARAPTTIADLPDGILLVDGRYDIHEINRAAHGLFGIRQSAEGQDLLHLVRCIDEGSLRQLIDAALRGERPKPLRDLLVDVAAPESRFVEVAAYPTSARSAPAGGSPEPMALLIVRDVSEDTRLRQSMVDRLDKAETAAVANNAMRAQVARREQELVDANQQLLSANERLRDANEVFVLSTQQARASTEQVEMINEELQATNEELETLNEEFHATIEELNTTNDDLEARGRELVAVAETADLEHRRLEAMMSAIPDAVLVVDDAGAPLLKNAAFDRLFPTGLASIFDEAGNQIADSQLPQRRAAQRESFRLEFSLPEPKTQTGRSFEAFGAPLGDDMIGGVIVVRDITERSARRLQDRFLAMASHELRTPLVPLQGYLEMIARSTSDLVCGEKVNRHASAALAQVKKLTALVGDLVDVMKVQSGKFALESKRVDLVEVVEDTVRVAAGLAEPMTIEVVTPNEPVAVMGDATRLAQVLMNLLTNAIRYAVNSDRIEVRVRRVPTEDKGEAEFVVRDFGPGIPVQEQGLIFDAFHQAQDVDGRFRGGLGLGLYICRSIVEQHGGRISVRSHPPDGAEFTVRLPLASP